MFKIFSPAKINLCLDVLYKRNDGYHEIKTIMQKIKIGDYLYFDITKNFQDDNYKNNIKITSNNINLPIDENNLCYKAILYLKKNYNINDFISLHIEKNIPIAAGLGGGSSNFYYCIDFLNKFYNLKLSKKEIVDICNQYGSDIAFFSMDCACLCEGRGEILTPLNNLDFLNINIETPHIYVSTKEIFNEYDNIEHIDHKNDIQYIIDNIKSNNIDRIYDRCFNALEDVTIKKYPIINSIKQKYINKKLALMSGSGPTVFYID